MGERTEEYIVNKPESFIAVATLALVVFAVPATALDLPAGASIVGDCRVFGRIEYLEVWNDQRFLQKLQREAWTDEDGMRLSEHGI